MKIDGHCHCGAIAYEAEIDPEKVYVCHCTDCQAISGGTFRWAVPVAAADFRLLKGAPRTYVKTTESGATNHQVFCGDCAAPLYSEMVGRNPRVLNLRLGTARQRDRLPPGAEYWCRSAQAWIAVKGPTQRVEKQ